MLLPRMARRYQRMPESNIVAIHRMKNIIQRERESAGLTRSRQLPFAHKRITSRVRHGRRAGSSSQLRTESCLETSMAENVFRSYRCSTDSTCHGTSTSIRAFSIASPVYVDHFWNGNPQYVHGLLAQQRVRWYLGFDDSLRQLDLDFRHR